MWGPCTLPLLLEHSYQSWPGFGNHVIVACVWCILHLGNLTLIQTGIDLNLRLIIEFYVQFLIRDISHEELLIVRHPQKFVLPVQRMWHSGVKWTWIVHVVSGIWSSGLTACSLVGVIPMESCCSNLNCEDKFIEMVVPICQTAWYHTSGNWSPDANCNDNPISQTICPVVPSY
jgi:hypothetical protein